MALRIIICFGSFLLFSCKINPPPVESEPELELLDTISLDISEPSGLSLNVDNSALYAVSDQPDNQVYKISLIGETLDTLKYTGNDIEGISLDSRTHSLWIVEEALGEIVEIDTLGNELQRISISGVSEGSGGLEGITINPNNGHYYLLKEKDSGVLIELDEAFNLLSYRKIFFADDYSGICYEPNNNQLWIVSDQDSKVFQCDLEGNVLYEFPIIVPKAEGISVDLNANRIYIVSDSNENLYLYSLKE